MTWRRSWIVDRAGGQPLQPAHEPSMPERTFVCLGGIDPLVVEIELKGEHPISYSKEFSKPLTNFQSRASENLTPTQAKTPLIENV